MKPIILLHGALGSKEQMSPLADVLAGNYQVYNPDFSGHGEKSDLENEFIIEDFADELNQYIIEKGVHKPLVFGYSMGGFVALYHAYKYPGGIDKIITLATKFDWNAESAQKESRQLDIETLKIKVPDYVNLLKQRHSIHWDKVVLKTARMMMRLGEKNELSNQKLREIKTPVMLCLGDNDKMVSFEETEQVASLIPDAVFKILIDSSHPFERVDYNKLAELIHDFVSE